MQNFIGNFAGWVAPMLTGFLVQWTGRFYWPFFITAAIAWVGALSWAWIVGPVEQVDWHASAAGGTAAAAEALSP
jgi:hypothetical protein